MTDEQQTHAELQQLLRDIAGMCEADVDAMLADSLHYPCGEDLDGPLREACFRRLAVLRGAPIGQAEAEVEMDALRAEAAEDESR